MNNLRRKSNLLMAFAAFASFVISCVVAVSNQLQVLEFYKQVYPSGSMMIEFTQQRFISNIITSVIQCLPALLFVIYALFLYKKNKKSALLTGSFAFSVAFTLWNIASTLIAMSSMEETGRVENYVYIPISQEEINQQFMPPLIIGIIILAIYIFFIVDVATNFKLAKVSKILTVVFTGVICAKPIILNSIETEYNTVRIDEMISITLNEIAKQTTIVQVIAALLLGVAFIIFWWLAVPNDSAKLSKSDLDKLRERFEAGKIDEQTYKKKREEILDKI